MKNHKIKYSDRIIMSSFGGIEFKPTKQNYSPELSLKPKGLWYALGTSWIDWVRSNMPEWESDNLFKIDINDSKIIKITNKEELIIFYNKYKCINKDFPILSSIDWELVSKDYLGIEISPYKKYDDIMFDYEFLWYYGWDVPSGCIWGDDVIVDIKKLNKELCLI